MPIPPIELPDLDLKSLSDEDKANLDNFIAELLRKINEIISAFNTEHP